VADASKWTDVPGHQTIADLAKLDAASSSSVSFLVCSEHPSKRLIVSPTGPINRDFDDARRFYDAGFNGITKVKKSGAVKPLIIFADAPLQNADFSRAIEVTLFGVFQALYEPLQGREHKGADYLEPVRDIGFHVVGNTGSNYSTLAENIRAVEAGRRLARDLGGPDPERMAPGRFADYIEKYFKDVPNVKVTFERDGDALAKSYPLLHSVARASLPVPRHRPVVVRLEYEPEGNEVQQTLLFAGKGVTYDTGGSDIKISGSMAGMSRDKCGAAAVAGFVLSTALLKPKHLKVVAELGVVRNSIGAEGYVADEVIISHGGSRVKIGNTDAEGRLVLADCLSHLREYALKNKSINPHLFTVATLTGHVGRTYGPYSATIDNGPATQANEPFTLKRISEIWADPFEVSTIRREDYSLIAPKNEDYDVLQNPTGGSVATSRGHQFPAAFLMIAAGLDKHSKNSEHPLKYSHLDIAGSAVDGGDYVFGKTNATPIVALTAKYVFQEKI
jgi:leucyl aminopeptidase